MATIATIAVQFGPPFADVDDGGVADGPCVGSAGCGVAGGSTGLTGSVAAACGACDADGAPCDSFSTA